MIELLNFIDLNITQTIKTKFQIVWFVR